MKSVEELEYLCGWAEDDIYYEGYEDGKAEQKAIDIEKAKKAFCDTCMGRCEDKTHCDTLQRYINALEE